MWVNSSLLRQSPLLQPVCCLMLGMSISLLCLDSSFRNPALTVVVSLGVLIFILSIFNRGRTHRVAGLKFLLFICVGFLWHHVNCGYRPENSIDFVQSGEDLTVIAKLKSLPKETRTGGVMELETIGIETDQGVIEPRSGKVQVSLGPASWDAILQTNQFLPGTILRCEMVLRDPAGFIHPGTFDAGRYLATSGIYRLGAIAHPEFISVIRPAPTYLPQKLMGQLQAISKARLAGVRNFQWSSPGQLAGECYSVSQALLLGLRKTLDPSTLENFRRAGLIHLLAISGLHLGVLAGILNWLLKRFPGTTFTRSSINVVIIWCYAFLTGCPTSVMRSAMLITVYLLARLIHRPVSLLNCLALVAGILLFLYPGLIVDPGFQLTFAATGGIAVLYKPYMKLFCWLPGKWLAPALAVSLAAQSATLPISAYWFNRVGCLSFLTGLPLAPVTSLALISGICTMVLPDVPLLSDFVGLCHTLSIRLLLYGAEKIAEIPLVTLEVVTPPLWLAIGVSAIIFLPALLELRWWISGVFCVTALLVLMGGGISEWPVNESLEIWFIDVGNGDCCFLRLPDGTTMLIDAGGIYGSEFDVGQKIVLRTLRTIGIDHLDIAVITHPHPDHQLGFSSILKSLPPGELWIMDETFNQPQFQEILSLARQQGTHIRNLDSRGIFDVFPVSTNNRSVVLGIRYGWFRLLLPGDTEEEIEDNLSEYGPHIRSTVLKAGHHGSRSSSSETFLKTVEPEIIFIPSGVENQFGHPHLSVIKRIHSLLPDSPVFRSDKHGTVFMKTDGRTLEIQWMTGQTPG